MASYVLDEFIILFFLDYENGNCADDIMTDTIKGINYLFIYTNM